MFEEKKGEMRKKRSCDGKRNLRRKGEKQLGRPGFEQSFRQRIKWFEGEKARVKKIIRLKRLIDTKG